MIRPTPWFLTWMLWLIVLFILSSLSQPGPRIDVVGIDKIYHTLYFAAGGTLLGIALALHRPSLTKPPNLWKLPLLVILAGALVGGFDEWWQSYTPGRQGLDRYDWMADVFGSICSLPISRAVRRLLPQRLEVASGPGFRAE